jgi:hypothetical protein
LRDQASLAVRLRALFTRPSDDPDVVPVDSNQDLDNLELQQEKGGILIAKLRRGQEIKLKAIAKKVHTPIRSASVEFTSRVRACACMCGSLTWTVDAGSRQGARQVVTIVRYHLRL